MNLTKLFLLLFPLKCLLSLQTEIKEDVNNYKEIKIGDFVEFDKNRKVLSVEEKPREPKSNYCITGLYFYPRGVAEKAKQLKPSARNELEITDLNRLYLEEECLRVQILGRGFAWMDTGTMDSLMEASSFVQTVQNRQGVVISAPEEIAYYEKWITREDLLKSARLYGKSPYGEHLKRVAEDRLVY